MTARLIDIWISLNLLGRRVAGRLFAITEFLQLKVLFQRLERFETLLVPKKGFMVNTMVIFL